MYIYLPRTRVQKGFVVDIFGQNPRSSLDHNPPIFNMAVETQNPIVFFDMELGGA